MNRSLYPDGWEAFSREIRYGRAKNRCECTGQCGIHQPNPEPRRCNEIGKQKAKWFLGRVMLTVAHTCDCYPICKNPAHVLAMCQRCHLRFDRFRHAASRLRTQATPSYKSQRYRQRGKELNVGFFEELANLPARKRRAPWITHEAK